MVARIVAACRLHGIDYVVVAVALAGVLLGPAATNLITDALRQVAQCTAAHAINQTNKEAA